MGYLIDGLPVRTACDICGRTSYVHRYIFHYGRDEDSSKTTFNGPVSTTTRTVNWEVWGQGDANLCVICSRSGSFAALAVVGVLLGLAGAVFYTSVGLLVPVSAVLLGFAFADKGDSVAFDLKKDDLDTSSREAKPKLITRDRLRRLQAEKAEREAGNG